MYFEIPENKKNEYHNLSFVVQMAKNYNYSPELYFISHKDFSLGDDNPFLPMPLADYMKRDYDQFSIITIKPEISPGYYILKFLKNPLSFPIKVQATANDYKRL